MTTETPTPQPEMGPAPDAGQVQSVPSGGHRRRRRRRKNKSNQQNGQQGQQPQMQPQGQGQAPPQSQHPPQQPSHQPQQRQAHHNNNNQPRKKKKFFQKGPGQQAQPGNSVSGHGQGKRKNKQRGPREFIGPMDHSYRTVNGNVADGPPSTIPIAGNNHGGYYADAYAQAAPAPARENAPTRIFCFIDDLFFQAKISETAKKLGIKVEFVKGDKDSVQRLLDLPDSERPTLMVFDLNNLNAKPLILIPKFKAKLKKATSIVGFLNHLQGDLKLKAVEAGCDTVMPRSAFSQSLPNLLRRYGVEEEEEYSQQPV